VQNVVTWITSHPGLFNVCFMTKQDILRHTRHWIDTTAAEIKSTDKSHTLLAATNYCNHENHSYTPPAWTNVEGIKKCLMCAPVTCKKPHLNMYQTALDAQIQTLNADIVVKRQKKMQDHRSGKRVKKTSSSSSSSSMFMRFRCSLKQIYCWQS